MISRVRDASPTSGYTLRRCVKTLLASRCLCISPSHNTIFLCVSQHNLGFIYIFTFHDPSLLCASPHTTSDFSLYISHTTSNFSVYPHGINRCLCVSSRLLSPDASSVYSPEPPPDVSVYPAPMTASCLFVYPTHMIIPSISPNTTDVSVFPTSAIRWFQRFMLTVHKGGFIFKNQNSSSL
jgi:hypothetical protein